MFTLILGTLLLPTKGIMDSTLRCFWSDLRGLRLCFGLLAEERRFEAWAAELETLAGECALRDRLDIVPSRTFALRNIRWLMTGSNAFEKVAYPTFSISQFQSALCRLTILVCHRF